eukprot:GFYU01009673.1.p1 GENE.GFYU01009673.1~~GFYU01009673.1.p1  ORF type:complete len:171 (+),score=34.20 GFYU01009673.1:90-602(+)
MDTDLELVCTDVSADVKEYKITKVEDEENGVSRVEMFAPAMLVLAFAYYVLFWANWVFYVLIFLVVLNAHLHLKKQGIVKEESVLLMQELGIQLKTKYAGGKEKTFFIDKSKIKNVIINEGITNWSVIYYIAFVVEGHNQLIVAYSNLCPRLNLLQKVYHPIRAMISSDK